MEHSSEEENDEVRESSESEDRIPPVTDQIMEEMQDDTDK